MVCIASKKKVYICSQFKFSNLKICLELLLYIRMLNNHPPLNKGNFDFLKKSLIHPPSIRDFLRFHHGLKYIFQYIPYNLCAFPVVISSHKCKFFLGSAPRPPKNFLAGIRYMIPSKNVISGLQKPDILHHEIR